MFLKKMKEELKALGAEIRTNRRLWKEAQSTQKWEIAPKPGWRIQMDSADFRNKHIAYCLLRGRTYEQVEPKVRDGNGPRWDLINKLVDAGKLELAKEKEAYDAAQAVRASAG